jgi:ATP-binding cassette subfamily B protein
MGLFSLKEGEITIDGKIVNKANIDAWQKNILHVPQTSSLIDSTILENIGYGHKLEDIDMEKAKLAAKKGEILEFIQETKNGFLTTIGEKGVRISGGQRQRLSLAKVFYNNAQLILLDEATNALDSINESKVFKNLREISKNKIILIISHGNLIEKFCDSTIEIKNLK